MGAGIRPDPDAPGRVAFREAAFLDDVDGFDNDLFGIAAREAAQMDPQHRIMLEMAWAALEDAGQQPDSLGGVAAGVFLGLNGGDHLRTALAAPRRLDTHALAGGVASIAAGRIAYALGLAGPAMVVDTACSSSLVAVHLAVQSLRSGECTLALAGGVHLMLTPHVSVALSRARMMAPDGRCKPFDAAADGFGQGEGCGVVVLKRLADAVAAGDRVLAVIRGSALNQDGRSAGITAPSQGAQAAVIRAALADARLEPAAVDCIEAHGTGTALGDPVEMHAIASVFGQRARALAVGSVKANIGHTAAAAGVAGLIRAVLMLRHQAVPPNPHFRTLNPHIDLGDAAIEVPSALTPMRLDCIGVSSFGFSGTNAHVVLQASPQPPGRKVALPASPFQRRHFPRLAADPAADQPSETLRLIDSPSSDRQLECWLDLGRMPWLADHRVQGRVIVPGAVMIALMLAAAPPPADALAGIVFLEPVMLADDPVRLVAVARPDGSVGVGSRTGADWTWHATGALCVPGVPLGIPAPGQHDWTTRAAWTAHLAALGIEIGPTFQGIARISKGPISTAELQPEVAAAAPAAFTEHFHPALLDAALQAAGGTLPPEPVLPVSIARLSLHDRSALQGGAANPPMVFARRSGDFIDLEVLTQGRAAVTVEGLAVRGLADSLPPVVAALSWVETAAPGGGRPARVFEVAPAGANLPEGLRLLQSMLGNPQPIAFVTRGATPPVMDPGAALFAGLASAMAEERPELRCRCIDVASGTPAKLLEDELARIDGEPVVALRAEGRFVPRLGRITRTDGTVRLGGTVLITGGLGGIGRHAAAWAVARGAEAVLLVGRNGGAPPPDLPARVLAADITDSAAQPALVAALSKLPPLRSVIHAAGVLRDGLIEDQTPSRFAEVVDPKLTGAWALHALAARRPVEHFLLFGSVASLIGAAGQSNYAAANAALDAFAEWRRARGLPATSIAWGRWSDTGMAAGLSPAQTARVAARGLLGMTPARALAALDAAILSNAPRVMVAALDLPRLAQGAPMAFAGLLPEPLAPDGPIAAQVAAAVGQILGQPAQSGQPLVACGLDSLMAMDLRNRLNRRFGIGLRLADLMDGTDVEGLAALVESAAVGSDAMEVMTL